MAQTDDDQTIIMRFPDPALRQAVCVSTRLDALLAAPDSPDLDAIDILTVPSSPKDDPGLRDALTAWVEESISGDVCPTITIKVHGAEVVWRPGRAAILAVPERIELLLLALVDFSYYDNELRNMEGEIAASWPELERDTPLAYKVTPADLEQQEFVGKRMEETLQRRRRHARIEPHLFRPAAHLPAAAQELGERLRERARIDDRLEALDGQLEVFEHVYEMNSQRISEFRSARQERTLMWVIIVLLATETLLLLAELLWSLEI